MFMVGQMVSEMNFVHHISKVFRDFGGGYSSAITHTMSHELGHGVYKLQHTFAYKQLAETKGKTDNLMDYNGGSFLAHYQWRVMQDSVMFVWKVLQEDEDGMHSDSDCKNVWLTPCATSLSSVVENHLGLFEELHHTGGKEYWLETSYGKSISIDNFPDWTSIRRDNIDYMEQIHENEDADVNLSALKKGNVYVDFVLKSERRELNTIFKGWTIYIYAFKDNPTLSGYKIHKNSEYESNSRVKVLYKDCLGGDVFVCFFDEDGALAVVFQLDYFEISSSSSRIMRGKKDAEYWRDYLLNSYIYNWTEELQEEKPLQERFMPTDRYIVSVNDATIRKSEDRTKFENKNIPMGTEVVIESESEVNGKVVAYVKLVDSDPELFYYTTKSNLTKIEVLEKPEDAFFIFGNSVKLPYSSVPTGESHDLKDEFKVIARCGDYVRIASSSLKEFRKNSEGFWIKEPKLTAAQISEARKEIEKITDVDKKAEAYLKLQKRVMFKNQRNNESTLFKKDSKGKETTEKVNIGDVMCNVTCTAMALEMLGLSNPCANDIPPLQYEDCIEKNITWEHEGTFKYKPLNDGNKYDDAREWAAGRQSAVRNMFGDKVAVTTKVDLSVKKDIDKIKALIMERLKLGDGVIVSYSGHFIRIKSCDDNGYYYDDPYGKYTITSTGRSWNGNYNGKTSEEGVGQNNYRRWSDFKILVEPITFTVEYYHLK